MKHGRKFFALSVILLVLQGWASPSRSIAQETMDRGGYPTFLQAVKVVVLTAEVNGLVTDVIYRPQDFVSQGDIIVKLDVDLVDLEIERIKMQLDDDTTLERAKVVWEYSSDNLRIVKDLYETEIDSVRVAKEKELKEAEQNEKVAQLDIGKVEMEIEILKLELSRNLKIRDKHLIDAPMDGVIVPLSSVKSLRDSNVKAVEVGETVQAGQVIAALMRVDRLRVSKPLLIEQLDSVQLGRQAKVYVQGRQDAPIDGEVVFISPTVDVTGKFHIEVEFDNPVSEMPEDAAGGEYRYLLRHGMRARVELVEESTENQF